MLAASLLEQSFDLQTEITNLEEMRKQREFQQLQKVKQSLRAAQEQLKNELSLNIELRQQAGELGVKQSEQ